MAQLSRIPKEMRDNWSARIYQVDNGIYHLEPDAGTKYQNPWKLVEDMAKDPEKMGSILGMMEEEGPPEFPGGDKDGPGLEEMDDLPFQNMNQMFNAILQLQANVANLTTQNQNLQTQIEAMEAAGPPAVPPPWAPPGLAPGAIHGAGIPPPVINLDAGAIGAVIAQAMPAPLPQTA